MRSPTSSPADGLTVATPEDVLVAFVHELRAAGLRIGTREAVDFCRAVALLDATSTRDVFHAGRGLLVRRQADLATYRTVFGRFFLDEGDDLQAADDDAALHALPATR